ncbi:hypothetical protein JCM17823_21480 [Halorubrum gandharaense]
MSLPAAQYERLAALADARGLDVETQLARLVDDAYEGAGATPEDGLPLGVCDGSERE